MDSQPTPRFVISSSAAQQEWARWISHVLKEAGHRTYLPHDDVRPGEDIINKLREVMEEPHRTILVLPAEEPDLSAVPWRSGLSSDPAGHRAAVIPVCVAVIELPEILRGRQAINLYGKDAAAAQKLLLDGISDTPPARGAPEFPGTPPPAALPNVEFPGPVAVPALATVLDAAGATCGVALLVGVDMAVTSRDALDRAGARPELALRGGERLGFIEVDRADRLGVALLRIKDRPRPNGGWPRFEPPAGDVNVRLPAVGPTASGGVEFVTRLAWDSSGDGASTPQLHRAPPRENLAGTPVLDETTSAVVGVIRSSDGRGTPAIVLADAILDRWPGLALPDDERTYQAVVPNAVPAPLVAEMWLEFNPAHLQCLVVTSEAALADPSRERLDALVRKLASDRSADAVWESFRGALKGRARLVDECPRDLPERSLFKIACVSVLDVFDNAAGLALATRLVVEADLAVFDVTEFEPGVMLLLGIRAATRRGVTIVSHGRWEEGDKLERPFNLSDIALTSHKPKKAYTGGDPRVPPLVKRIAAGFDEFAIRPRYRDLPAYDALREMGPSAEAQRTIGIGETILVLCSYDTALNGCWENIRDLVKQVLADERVRPDVIRLQDTPDPRLVTLSLYDKIRRCSGCIADWSKSSPSTFFELGVRLAVSQRDVIQVVSASRRSHRVGAAGGHLIGRCR